MKVPGWKFKCKKGDVIMIGGEVSILNIHYLQFKKLQ